MKFLILSLFFLSSCAQMQKQWHDSTCNIDAAYSKGVQDAQNSKSHDNSEFARCGEGVNIGSLQKSYSEGFSSIAKNPMHILKKTLDRADAYYECTYNIFNESFSTSGSSESEAKYKAVQKCKRSKHSFHCSNINIDCRKI